MSADSLEGFCLIWKPDLTHMNQNSVLAIQYHASVQLLALPGETSRQVKSDVTNIILCYKI